VNSEWSWQTAAITAPFAQAGRIGVNHDQPSQATMLYIHRLDSNNYDRGGYFERMGKHDTVYMQQKTVASSWHRYVLSGRPTRQGDCWLLPVATFTGSPVGTEPPNASPVLVSIQGDL